MLLTLNLCWCWRFAVEDVELMLISMLWCKDDVNGKNVWICAAARKTGREGRGGRGREKGWFTLPGSLRRSPDLQEGTVGPTLLFSTLQKNLLAKKKFLQNFEFFFYFPSNCNRKRKKKKINLILFQKRKTLKAGRKEWLQSEKSFYPKHPPQVKVGPFLDKSIFRIFSSTALILVKRLLSW